MKDELVQFVFAVVSVVVAAGLEELLPSFFGFGFPLLLSLVVYRAPRTNVLHGVMTAFGAGAFEDALSSLAPMTSICFFVVASLVARRRQLPVPLLVMLFPAYALWAGLCAQGPIGDMFARVLVSLPMGALAMVGAGVALEWAGGKAGVDG